MGPFELLAWMILLSVGVGIAAGVPAILFAWAIEAYEVELRALRRRVRGFFGQRKEATP